MISSLPGNRLNLLLTFGQDLLAIEDLATLMERALDQMLLFTGYDGGSILLYQAALDVLEVCAVSGHDTVPVGTQVPDLARSIAGHVFTTGRPLVIYGRGEEVGTDWRDYTRDIPTVVCLPMLYNEGRSVGVLSLRSHERNRRLDADDLETLQLLTTQLARVVENARLHAERERLLNGLAEREAQLQHLLGLLLTAQEEERRRVAYDLHDGLAQTAASAYQHLQSFAARYRPRSPEQRETLRQALDLTRQSVKDARNIIAELRPTALDDLGLVAAVRLELEALRAQDWDVTFEVNPPCGRLAPVCEAALFRIAQEALQNVRKHAGCERVLVQLGHDGAQVRLVVRDWGCGYQPPTTPPRRGERIGLLSMREQVSLLGGTFFIDGQPGEGTTVTVTVPDTAGKV